MPNPKKLSPTTIGRQAEAEAARYLVGLGHQLLDQNWRTRFCELDIVTIHQGVVHIVEVKYRESRQWGTAVEYVVPAKIARLQRAAAAWCQAKRYSGAWQIDIVAVDGPVGQTEITYVPNALFS